MSERMGVRHDCHQPYRNGIVRRKAWMCPVCRRTWEPHGEGGWFTDEEGGEVIGFVMRYPDGSTKAFGKRELDAANGRRPSDDR